MARRAKIWRTERVSEFYDLKANQATLEFVDVDVVADTRLYVDPRALRLLAQKDSWAQDCVDLLRDYFQAVLKAVLENRETDGLRLLRGLSEPNDTRLGMSRRQAEGRGVGKGIAEKIWESFRASEAAESGLLDDLEDSALMIEGVATDRISDIATNVIRGPLIGFTQDMCEKYEIETEAVLAGLMWDPKKHIWISGQLEELPAPKGRPLVFVPKTILRTKLDFDPDEYYGYVIDWLRDWELSQPNSELIYLVKSTGQNNVTKKSVAAKYRRRYGNSKKDVTTGATLDNPGILESFREEKKSPFRRRLPPTYAEIAKLTDSEPPDLLALMRAVKKVKRGADGASTYHRCVFDLFNILFWPELQHGESEVKSHGGQKRLDIRYVNVTGGKGFFSWVAANYGNAQYLVVECKNYSGDPANPELDQLIGRFTRLSGKFGILACRGFRNKERFIERCREAARSGQGFVLPLDDSDLEALVSARKGDDQEAFSKLLHTRFQKIIG